MYKNLCACSQVSMNHKNDTDWLTDRVQFMTNKML